MALPESYLRMNLLSLTALYWWKTCINKAKVCFTHLPATKSFSQKISFYSTQFWWWNTTFVRYKISIFISQFSRKIQPLANSALWNHNRRKIITSHAEITENHTFTNHATLLKNIKKNWKRGSNCFFGKNCDRKVFSGRLTSKYEDLHLKNAS